MFDLLTSIVGYNEHEVNVFWNMAKKSKYQFKNNMKNYTPQSFV